MIAMSIAGFDPSGGAGILNDIKTFSAFGVYGTAVITALTAQNINKVEGVQPVDVQFIKKQIDTVLEQEKIEFAKTGMLYSDEIIKAVAQKVAEHDLKVVVDPVMIAGSGGHLSQKNFARSLKKYLLPVAALTTPNIHEAQEISGVKIENTEDSIEAALKIGETCNVVVTGGHLEGTDILFDGSIKVIKGELVESSNTHGSGCTYSSAIVSSLVKGDNIETAVKKAGEFVKESIKHGNMGTLNQFWKCI
ncbi:bifunctional hydroxymethylpyrimidine kinase/phosphomethylpyrimidine kinase [Methanobacterium sp. MBAC-LM]|uniref:bifunctional hydroxymethylpyrimidine kinase/phosphomethylpyrimidine kinase n=1 Tax=Methanobacterium sp. MBAC-LM TaxID=3412034 RepID=UPI003C70ECE5